MKKVAILTITNSGMNFGNRLQNYALQEALRNVGAKVATIRSAKSIGHSFFLSNTRRLVKGVINNSIRKKLYSEFEREYIEYDPDFRYENINESSFADKYDIFIAGSDQIWNPYFKFNSDFEFATFAPSKKRYSYAASIGVTELDEEKRKKLTENLLGMRRLSIREQDGVELVKELTGIVPARHIDPTMLLDIEEYIKIEKKPKNSLPEKYLFMYFLGNVSGEYQKNVREIASAFDLEIVQFSENPGDSMYNLGPLNFLYIVHHADFVCTDSLHGLIFSLLYKKKFAIFTRQDKEVSMNGRMQTMISLFGLESRMIENLQKDYELDIDYVGIEKRLSLEREKSFSYLREIINEP